MTNLVKEINNVYGKSWLVLISLMLLSDYVEENFINWTTNSEYIGEFCMISNLLIIIALVYSTIRALYIAYKYMVCDDSDEEVGC